MMLAHRHKGMKIAVSLTFFVGEGFQTLPDIAPRCLFSEELARPAYVGYQGAFDDFRNAVHFGGRVSAALKPPTKF